MPRDSLKKQAAEAFADPRWRSYLGHRCDIREADNEPDPSRGSKGYATTIQAIGADPALHARDFQRYRYVLVIDEMHHVAKGSLWAEALGALIEHAAMVIYMSGTLSRDDNKPIAFIRYEDLPDGTSGVVLESEPDYRVIRYTRAQALAEEATLPIYFERLDGAARWIDVQGVEREVSNSCLARAEWKLKGSEWRITTSTRVTVRRPFDGQPRPCPATPPSNGKADGMKGGRQGGHREAPSWR